MQQGTKPCPKGHLGCSSAAAGSPPLPGTAHGSDHSSFLISRSKLPCLGNQDKGYVFSVSAPLLPWGLHGQAEVKTSRYSAQPRD